MNEETNDRMLTVEMVAGCLGICTRGVRRLVASDELPPPVKIGGSSRWFWSEVAAYLERLKTRRDSQLRRAS
ncbi:MAG: helix-turn-helix transcriptional regulator [Verrucomicrobiales bacterium]